MLAAVTLLGIASGYELPNRNRCLAAILPRVTDEQGRLVFINGHAGIIVGVTSTGELRVRLCAEKATNSVAAREIWLKPGT